MKTLIDIFNDNNVSLDQSVYYPGIDKTNDVILESKNHYNNLLNFPLPMANELNICDENLIDSQFYSLEMCKNYIEKNKLQDSYKKIEEQIKDLNKQIEKSKKTNNYQEIIALRKQKKFLRKKYNSMKLDLEYQVYNKIFNNIIYPKKPKSLFYRNTLALSSFENICLMVPELKYIRANFINDAPWFIKGLNKLRDALNNQEKIGVEGGPCLFLQDEFYVILEHTNGSIKKFDYVDFKERYIGSPKKTESLLEYMRQNGPNIKSVEIDCNKYDIVMREYDHIQYLFEIAKALNAKLVITIPDMSYRKSFYNIFKTLPPDVFSLTKKKFFQKFDSLSNAIFKWINISKKQYEDVNTIVFRYAEKNLCKKFYHKRNNIHLNSSEINHITKNREMLDAVTDYIFMPALPYFLFGTKNIVEIIRFEEWRTVEKCEKFIKNINFTMLFPLRLSKGIENIIYNQKG